MPIKFVSVVPILRIFDIAKADEFTSIFWGSELIGIIALMTTRPSIGKSRVVIWCCTSANIMGTDVLAHAPAS